MNPAEKAWRTAVCASQVLVQVEARLVDAGALTELRQLHRLSAQEVDVLVFRETHEPCAVVPTDAPTLPPSSPQTTRAEVAA